MYLSERLGHITEPIVIASQMMWHTTVGVRTQHFISIIESIDIGPMNLAIRVIQMCPH